MRRTPGYPESMHCYEPFCTESAPHAAAVVCPRRRPAQKPRKSHRTPHQPKRRRMPDPALREDTAPSSHPRAHPHTAFTCALRCEGDPTNRRRPPAAPGNASPHPCRCPDSRRAPTPHLRTPYAGTARAHTSSRAPSRSLETGFSAYGSRARATPAIRPRTVHMTWDREA